MAAKTNERSSADTSENSELPVSHRVVPALHPNRCDDFGNSGSGERYVKDGAKTIATSCGEIKIIERVDIMSKETTKYGPNPNEPYPMEGFKRVCFIKNFVKKSNIIIGDYTYYDDPENPEDFEEKSVLYNYDFLGDKLIIGRFCAIATGVKFIMNGANHKIKSFTTYPFGIFGKGWEEGIPKIEDLPYKGDTIIGNDVWIGYDTLVMPGIKVGDGAIIAAKSVVTKDVEPYTIVGGNPAIEIKKRFDNEVVQMLIKLKWWNWDIKKVTESINILTSNDLNKLKELL